MDAQLESLFEGRDPREVTEAIIEWFEKTLEREKLCFLTGNPISSPAECFYCRKRCVLAGRSFSWKQS